MFLLSAESPCQNFNIAMTGIGTLMGSLALLEGMWWNANHPEFPQLT